MNEYLLKNSTVSKPSVSYDSRYYFTPRIIDTKNILLFDLFEKVDYTDYQGFQYHIVTTDQQNRLDLVAYQFYEDASYWWLIAMANKIIDPFILQPGTQLRIPSIASFMIGGQNSIGQ